MKKIAIILAVLLLAGLACAAQAVTLQQGWFAQFDYIDLREETGPVAWGTQWLPTSNPGQYGPVLVQAGYYVPRYGRIITITQTVSIQPGVIFEDYGIYSGGGSYFSQLYMGWSTNYDANRLQLQVFRHHNGESDELVWSQSTSGPVSNGGNIWSTSPLLQGEDLIIRIVVVPEPSSYTALATALLGCIGYCYRRKR